MNSMLNRHDAAVAEFGPYLYECPEDFELGVSTPAGRALVSAQVHVIEVTHPRYDNTLSEFDALAFLTVLVAREVAHLDLAEVFGKQASVVQNFFLRN